MACSFKIISSACLWTSSWKPLSYYSVCSTGTIARLGKDLSSVFQHLGLTGLFLTWYTCGSISVWRAFVISPGLLTNLYSEITASRKNMLNSFYPKEKKNHQKINRMMKNVFGLRRQKAIQPKSTSYIQVMLLPKPPSVLLNTQGHVFLTGVSPLHSTFNDFCNIPIGKPSVGSVVSQRRKSGWGFVIFSRAFSRVTSHLTKRWQFCNISHSPLTATFSSICRAILRERKDRLLVTLPLSCKQTSSNGLVQQISSC